MIVVRVERFVLVVSVLIVCTRKEFVGGMVLFLREGA